MLDKNNGKGLDLQKTGTQETRTKVKKKRRIEKGKKLRKARQRVPSSRKNNLYVKVNETQNSFKSDLHLPMSSLCRPLVNGSSDAIRTAIVWSGLVSADSLLYLFV